MKLGIDCSGGRCAVALVGGARTVVRAEQMTRGHAERLMPMVDEALAEAGVGFRDLELIGVCTGPGSFTGVRISVAAGRGIGLALGIPCIGVTRFLALAAGALSRAVTVVLPGRGTDRHAQDFDGAGQAVADPRTYGADAANSPDPGLFLGGLGPANNVLPIPEVDPALVASLAAERANAPPAAPFYLAPPDAALPADRPPRVLD